jgi:hypothetical protein
MQREGDHDGSPGWRFESVIPYRHRLFCLDAGVNVS